uniref:Uncharacterized protein n=1 Tax=Nelumbo nucifera TaxID=4432 RepID=A0A822XLK5_NELNU|nr:TPA_asm: hypothetical protein HUJ06_022056 [Nelumbo nucifera]
MMLVAIVAELLEQYTALLVRVLHQMFHAPPFPWRLRFLVR